MSCDWSSRCSTISSSTRLLEISMASWKWGTVLTRVQGTMRVFVCAGHCSANAKWRARQSGIGRCRRSLGRAKIGLRRSAVSLGDRCSFALRAKCDEMPLCTKSLFSHFSRYIGAGGCAIRVQEQQETTGVLSEEHRSSFTPLIICRQRLFSLRWCSGHMS